MVASLTSPLHEDDRRVRIGGSRFDDGEEERLVDVM